MRKALHDSVSEVASSQGDDVIARVRAERASLLTDGGRPRGAYADVIAERDTAAARVGDLDVHVAQYREQVDRLGQLRAEHAADAAATPWEGFRTQQREAAAQLDKFRALKTQVDVDQASLRQVEAHLDSVAAQLAGFEDQRSALKQREAALADAEHGVETAISAAATWTTAQQEADAAYRAATEAVAIAQEAASRADLVRRIADARERVAALNDALAKAEVEQARLTACRERAAAVGFDASDLTRLREQHAGLNELRIRQEAAATRVRFDLVASADVTLAGRRLSGIGEQLLTAGAELAIADVGRLQIVPGGADLAQLARDEAEQQAAHRSLLQRLGVSGLPEAEARHAAHRQALGEIGYSERAMAHLAPNGLEALRLELTINTARQTDAESRLAALGEPRSLPDGSADSLDRAQADLAAAKARLETIDRQAATAQHGLVIARTHRDAALRERDASKAALDDPIRQQKEQEAGRRFVVARAERDELSNRIATKQGEVDLVRPDILEQDVERLGRSADQTHRAFTDRQTDLALLQGKLEEAGAQGLEEERAEQALRAEATGRRVEELRLRAAALDLLLQLLESKRRELTKRLQAPLQRHVERYLQLLFPRAILDIGEDLMPGSLTRPGSHGVECSPAAELSFGAREQLGVISRLAYADLLKEAGRPTLIILDDALVHSDAQRLEQMKRVLFDASSRHQVLLFTCHPAAWRDLGVAPRTITLAGA